MDLTAMRTHLLHHLGMVLLSIGPGMLASHLLMASPLHISLPKYRLQPGELAVIVNDADPLSVRIGEYYRQARDLPAENLLHLNFKPGKTLMGAEAFTRLRTALLKATPEHIQAFAITWAHPYRVDCMSITSAMSFGFDTRWCSQRRCATTAHSPYYRYAGADPYRDLGIRPTMSIAAESFAEAKALIDRGIAADASLPHGTAYLVSTNDKSRNVRAIDYRRIDRIMQGWLDTRIVHDESIRDRHDVMFYFTGKSRIEGLNTLTFLPGAVADHLTSTGGRLNGGKQMSALNWLKAGASGSYGTVVEPCNHLGKFPNPAILLERYGSGNTLIEAYWKSVQQPGEGIFIGEPLAAPYDRVAIENGDGQALLRTRSLTPGIYQLSHAVSPVGPFRKLSKLLVSYHQQAFKLPDQRGGYYLLEATGTAKSISR